jgi:glycosyltransferase involved in cell wall biosynthesis
LSIESSLPSRPAAAKPRLRIAIVGHACSPGEGSEPGFTWNWAKHLAEQHDVTAFVFPHPVFRPKMDAYQWEVPESQRPRFVYVQLPGLDPWKPLEGEKHLRLHYALWQRQVLKELIAEHQRQPFDVAHHVSWGSLNQPPLIWKAGIPFVWGPIGGGQTWPAPFYHYAPRHGLTERLRSAAVFISRFNPAIRRAVKHADLIFSKNDETSDVLRVLGARRIVTYFDGGISPDVLSPRTSPRLNQPIAGPMVLLWAGRHEPRKGLPLVLEAMAKVRQEVRLLIAGDGPSTLAWQSMAENLGLMSRVEFLGRVPWVRMQELYATADAFLFTSLRDATGTVVLEAMAKSIPIIAFDHQGVGCYLTEETAVKIPVTMPGATVDALAAAIDRLAIDPAERDRLGRAGYAKASQELWSLRAGRMVAWYREAIAAHFANQPFRDGFKIGRPAD